MQYEECEPSQLCIYSKRHMLTVHVCLFLIIELRPVYMIYVANVMLFYENKEKRHIKFVRSRQTGIISLMFRSVRMNVLKYFACCAIACLALLIWPIVLTRIPN